MYSVGQGGLWGHAFWGQVIVSLRCVLLEEEGGVWLYHLSGAHWRSEWRPSWVQSGGTFACMFLLQNGGPPTLSFIVQSWLKIMVSVWVAEMATKTRRGHFGPWGDFLSLGHCLVKRH
jgi:hypothetical protein